MTFLLLFYYYYYYSIRNTLISCKYKHGGGTSKRRYLFTERVPNGRTHQTPPRRVVPIRDQQHDNRNAMFECTRSVYYYVYKYTVCAVCWCVRSCVYACVFVCMCVCVYCTLYLNVLYTRQRNDDETDGISNVTDTAVTCLSHQSSIQQQQQQQQNNNKY